MDGIESIHAGWGKALPPPSDGTKLRWLVSPDSVPPDVFVLVERLRGLPVPLEWPDPEEQLADALGKAAALIEECEADRRAAILESASDRSVHPWIGHAEGGVGGGGA